ncbi:MAG: murein biosynthesis integral membrane protein MurJ [Campylobacterota bacterium]|nr:murein biosynthesis integral membrane protein MurJ [Campylobacterota bacterium]
MLRSIFTNSFGILFSRVLGLARDLLTASALGANIYSDIFFVAFKLPNLFRRIFAEGAFTQVFLPAFTRSKHKAVFSLYIFSLFFATLTLLTLLVQLYPTIATKAIAIGFDENKIELAAPFVAINFYYLLAIFSVTFLSTFLHYKNHFATTSFATGLLNISLIVALLLSKDMASETIVLYLSYGVVVGGILQLLVHVIAIYKLKLSFIFIGGVKYFSKKVSSIKKESSKFKREFLPAIWGNSAAQIAAFLDTWLASLLLSGSISYLYYANRVFQLPLALFAIATSIAIFPKVARFLKHNQHTQALEYMSKAFWFLLVLLTFSTIGALILSEEIVTLLFERGAFSANDTTQTSAVLSMYMVGLIFFGINKLLLLWIYANQEQLKAAKIASFSLASNVLFSVALLQPMGASGLALASSLSGIVSFILTLRAFGKQNFLAIIQKKYLIYFIISIPIFTIIIYLFKEALHVYL